MTNIQTWKILLQNCKSFTYKTVLGTTTFQAEQQSWASRIGVSQSLKYVKRWTDRRCQARRMWHCSLLWSGSTVIWLIEARTLTLSRGLLMTSRAWSRRSKRKTNWCLCAIWVTLRPTTTWRPIRGTSLASWLGQQSRRYTRSRSSCSWRCSRYSSLEVTHLLRQTHFLTSKEASRCIKPRLKHKVQMTLPSDCFPEYFQWWASKTQESNFLPNSWVRCKKLQTLTLILLSFVRWWRDSSLLGELHSRSFYSEPSCKADQALRTARRSSASSASGSRGAVASSVCSWKASWPGKALKINKTKEAYLRSSASCRSSRSSPSWSLERSCGWCSKRHTRPPATGPRTAKETDRSKAKVMQTTPCGNSSTMPTPFSCKRCKTTTMPTKDLQVWWTSSAVKNHQRRRIRSQTRKRQKLKESGMAGAHSDQHSQLQPETVKDYLNSAKPPNWLKSTKCGWRCRMRRRARRRQREEQMGLLRARSPRAMALSCSCWNSSKKRKKKNPSLIFDYPGRIE